jgi:hypothetical protein
MTRDSAGGYFKVSTASWAEERELAEDCGVIGSTITYAAAKASAAATDEWSEEVEREERADPSASPATYSQRRTNFQN